jgi:hypothetical protein
VVFTFKEKEMQDYSLPYIVLNSLLKKYHDCMLKNNTHRAYEVATDMVEMSLTLQDMAHDKDRPNAI